MRYKTGYTPWNKGIKLEKPCEECGKLMSLHPYRFKIARFCNHKCYGKWKVGTKFSEETKRKMAKAQEGRIYPPMSEETKKKMSIAKLGISEKEWNGFSKDERHRLMARKDYVIWRTAIFMRDDYTCQICSKRGIELNADHIKPWALYPELRYSIDNGRTLCVDCHRQTDTWGGRSIYRATYARKDRDFYE